MSRIFPAEKFPAKITVEFNNYCNFQCTHCHRYVVNQNRPAGEFDFNLFKNIVFEVSRHPATILKIGGWGEPVLHPKFREMMLYSSENKIGHFCLQTVQSLESLSFIDLLELCKTVLVISVDGFDAPSYEQIRVGGNYQELRDQIEKFYQFRQKRKRSFPKIVVQRVVFPDESYEKLEKFKKNGTRVPMRLIFVCSIHWKK